MKTDKVKTQFFDSRNKQELLIYIVGFFIVNSILFLLCEVAGLGNIVLLSASIISIGDAIYYGLLWKELKKSMRIGLSIFFLCIGLAGFILYKNAPQANNPSGIFTSSNILAQTFGLFVVATTLIFIYKHKTPSFWNWV